ncbi:MAG: DegT/DnrJ/EryC1/StrS family aminotransferase [Polaribacter sp.]|uniref:DegT/DnrJ/EryC1/StrS family aminotransferase n=1 Tax=Polaribacter sp. TaxID=1920175 RepID=UPI002F34F4FC
MYDRIDLSSSEIFLKLSSGILTNNKKPILKFEEKIETYLENKKKVVALNSGTSAIHLALILSGVKKGDEVICQSFTYVASANPIIYQNATPVFIDSEKETWNICPKYLELAIKDRILKGKKPKAIIFVHLYGMPSKIDEIVKIANKYQIVLIEDAAEALGAEYKGRKCGTFGDFGIFSFNNNKIISTLGGGILICKNVKEKQRAIFLATQSRDTSVHYQHSIVGYNYRMSTGLAKIGIDQIDLLEKHVTARRSNNQLYQFFFNRIEGISVFKELNDVFFSNHWLSCILIDENITGFSREDLRLQLEKDNIESRPLWKPLHLQPVFMKYSYYGNSVCDNLFNIGLCLPSSSNLTKNDFLRITNSIKKIL